MRVQIVENQPNHRDIGVGLIHQPPHLVSEVLFGALFRYFCVPPACQGFAGQEQVPGALPPVLVVLTPGVSGRRWDGPPDVGQQLSGCLVEADQRPFGIVGFGIQIQDILRVSHEVGAHLGNAPLFLLPRLEDVFFRCRRTVSWDRESTAPKSTIRSANRRRVQWSWPSGAGLQAQGG